MNVVYPARKTCRWLVFLKQQEIVMYVIAKLFTMLTIIMVMTTGCANRATGSVSPSTNLSMLKTMYVKHYPSDNSGVNQEIADKLRLKGVVVTTGSDGPSSRVDAIVTYIDKWRWDLTMYMLELTITIRDPKTDAPLATGNSLHTSLTRKSQTEMVNEVVSSIYNSSDMPTTKNIAKIPESQLAQGNIASQQALSLVPANNAAEMPLPGNLSQKLQELKMLRDDGLITEEEYAGKRKKLIEKF